MGRTVAADGSIEEQADRIRASAVGSIQVGLLIGKGSAGAAPSSSPSTPSAVTSSAPGSSSGAGTGGSKEVLLALLPTPPAPDGAEGGAEGGAINVEWVQEHARQVLRMTCGGISLLGLFVCCTDALYQRHHPHLLEAVGAVAELVGEQQQDAAALVAGRTRLASPAGAAKGTASSSSNVGVSAPEMLLLHICSKPKRLTLFTLPAAAGPKAGSKGASLGQLVAAELRPNPQALSSLVEIWTVHQVDACIPLAAGAPAKRSASSGSLFPHLRAALDRLLRAEAEGLAAAEVATGPLAPAGESSTEQGLRLFQDLDSIQVSSLTGGDAAPGPATGSSSSGKGKSQGKGGGKGSSRSSSASAEPGAHGAVLHTQLLRPPPWATLHPSGDNDTIEEVAGVLRVHGTVSGVAVAGPRDSAASAFWSLKVDVLRSLRTRLDILVEDAEEALETSGEGQGEEGGDGAQAGGGGREQSAAGPEADILRLADTIGGTGADTRAFRKKWPQGQPLQLALPRRLLLPWRPGAGAGMGAGSGGKGALPLSDYPLPHEGENESLERLAAMLPLGVPGPSTAAQESLLIALEPASPELAPAQTRGAGASPGASAFWSVAPPEGAKSTLETSVKTKGVPEASSSTLLLGSALLVALLAVLVALYLSLF